MADLFLARHGATIWHEKDRYAGASDIALSDAGRVQAEALAAWAAPAGLDALWHSPLIRSRQTARPIAEATRIDPVEDARIREVDFGSREGQSMEEIEAEAPAEAAAFQANPVDDHWPGGEDPRAAARRGVACLRDIARAHPEGRVLVVTHTTLLRLVLCHFFEIPMPQYRTYFPTVANGSLTHLRLREDVPSLLLFNSRP